MTLTRHMHQSPRDYLVAEAPDAPVLFLSPEVLQASARWFMAGFPGMVTYAVKANPAEAVLLNLMAAGVAGFDVASPAEIGLVRSLSPGAALHYHNPVRSRQEIAAGVAAGVASWSVDHLGEWQKLAQALPRGAEVAVRFKLAVRGAAYDFGEKFGATEAEAVALLAEVAGAGFRPALTFHPGTQCADPEAWAIYIEAAGRIAGAAGVRLARLNLGGGFPSRRMRDEVPPLEAIFARIKSAVREVFGAEAPQLVCEPGRALVAEAVSLALQVKSLRGMGEVYLNDGIYGALAEQPVMGMTDRIRVMAPDGRERQGAARDRLVWGPTCDSLDRLPGKLPLPCDMEEGDYLLIDGMGAYSTATVTRFNGYGGLRLATVRALSEPSGTGHHRPCA